MFIFYLYKFRRWLGYSVLVLLIIANVVSTFVFSYKLDYAYRNEISRRDSAIIALNPLNSSSSFLLGVTFALMWFSYKNGRNSYHQISLISHFYSKLLANKLFRIIIMISGITLCLLIFFLPYPLFTTDDGTTKSVLSSILISIERQVFTAGIILFLTPCVLGKARAFRSLLGNRALIAFARLTNAALLVHGIILMWYYFGKYQILRINGSVIFMSFIALTILSYFLAVIFALMIETPLITMESLLWCPRKRKYLRESLNRLGIKRYESFKLTKVAKDTASNTSKSSKGSMKEISSYENSKINSVANCGHKFIRRSNSLDDEVEYNAPNVMPKTLLNDSEGSKNYTSFKEPMLSEN